MAGRTTKPPRLRTPTAPSRPPLHSTLESLPPSRLAHLTAAIEDEDQLPNLYDDEIEQSHTDQTALLAPTSIRSAQRATLMVLAGSAAGKVFRIESDRVTIGRSRGTTLPLSDAGISRVHCAITRDQSGAFIVEDLNSTNGIVVNGQRVRRSELRSSDRIQLGADAVLQFGFIDDAEEGLVNQLYEAATRDPLTRALNRRAFQERLSAEISYAARHRERLSAILLDIDHFKSINDSYGHAAGDSVLHDVAVAIATTLRGEDVFARYGGEEFVVLARGLELNNGFKLGERIRILVEETDFRVDDKSVAVTLSVGVAELGENEGDNTGDLLLRLADDRLYAAKRGGRNRVIAH